ncbi:FAD-binding protein [Streptomyces sp. NBC_00365]|nr:FAD-binding protein [Streptomyces sp. NBC_00365]
MCHASAHGIPVAVRGGGHGSDGHAMPGGALVVDLSATKAVTVDPQTRVVSGPSGSMVPARSEAREATVTIPHSLRYLSMGEPGENPERAVRRGAGA